MSTDSTPVSDWSIRYDHYDPEDEGRREALFALGNGLLVSRAAAHESVDNNTHYPGTYRMGLYNRLSSTVLDEEVENESLVNLPNWLPLNFRIKDGSLFSLNEVEILHYRQQLFLDKALLLRELRFRDQQGHETRLEERRFISMAQPHLMALEVMLWPENWWGKLEVISGLDGHISNNNVARYAPLNRQHLQIVATSSLGEDSMELKARTLQSGIDIALAARTRVYGKDTLFPKSSIIEAEENQITHRLHFTVRSGECITVEKVAALYTSIDQEVGDCTEAARQALRQVLDFSSLYHEHCLCWKQLWRRCSLEVNLPKQTRNFRLHMYQLLINLSHHTADLDVGLPPSGWQGEEYHGQIFWDELFAFPFLAFRFPSIARSLLLYRYRRLGKAKAMAAKAGYRGAMFPWRSASTGKEETPKYQYNLLSNKWMKDYTCYQRHVGAAIACNIYYYVEVTNDQDFLADYGAELLLEIARFWSSIAHYNGALDRYEIQGVAGPDEYHTYYPDSTAPGISNNTYTNVMAVWTLEQAPRVLEQLSTKRRHELWQLLELSEEEISRWKEISRKIRVVFNEKGILGQFEGFPALKEFNIKRFKEEHGNKRIDWVLQAQNDAVERYQVSKQADTSMLLYLLLPSNLSKLLERLGYAVSQDALLQTVKQHITYTAHESSLSRIAVAGALARYDVETSWEYFKQVQEVDLLPQEYRDSSEGIHIGAMGGTLAVLQHHYLGIQVQEGVLLVDPTLPKELEKVTITLFFRGVEITCSVTQLEVQLHSVHPQAAAVTVGYKNNTMQLAAGAFIHFTLSQ